MNNPDEYSLESPTTIKLGLLHTHPLDAGAADHPDLEGIGQFTHYVNIEQYIFAPSGDKRGLIIKEIAMNLAHCIATTGVPKEAWYFTCDHSISKELNFPSLLRFKI